MYDQLARTRLQEKLGYELWLLDFLSRTQETFDGGANISTITLTNRQPGANVAIAVTEVIGSGAAMKVMEAMSPLTFIASYKIFDMIFEWILEENHEAGKVRRVPWRFSEKIEAISNSKLAFPSLLRSEPYIKEYLFKLYSNLLKFRTEVVHKHNFFISGNKLRIDTNEDGQSYTLELDPGELGAFVRVAVAAANLLTNVLSFGTEEDRLLKYHLDRIKKLHGLPEFGQRKPILVNVILKVRQEEGLFPADLRFVRKEINRIHPHVDTLFNLKVIGLVNDKPSIGWFFPANSVPKEDVLELRPDSHDEYRISPSEGN